LQSVARFSNDLVDYVMGGLTAPISQARRELAS